MPAKAYRYFFRWRINKSIVEDWIKKGKPLPPPHQYKQFVVGKYRKKYKIKIFIETGTYLGEMVFACKKSFKQIFSIELDKELALKAAERFREDDHIHIIHGDSSVELATILSKINSPVLFWLDGHYSEGFTSKGDLNTPILRELKHIMNHRVKNHVILIDDSRCFIGKDDYPTVDELRIMVNTQMPQMIFEDIDDIIRITPAL
jgi:hypothetical protein